MGGLKLLHAVYEALYLIAPEVLTQVIRAKVKEHIGILLEQGHKVSPTHQRKTFSIKAQKTAKWQEAHKVVA